MSGFCFVFLISSYNSFCWLIYSRNPVEIEIYLLREKPGGIFKLYSCCVAVLLPPLLQNVSLSPVDVITGKIATWHSW